MPPSDNYPLHNEPELVEALSAGDENAFTALYRHYSTRVFDAAMMYLKDHEEATEIVQTIFIRLWEKRDKLAQVISFKDYLFIIARNEVFRQFREKARISRHTAQLATLGAGQTDDTDYKARESQLRDLLQKGAESLPPQRRKVYELSRIEEKSIDEIAAEMNISRNTARNHLALALRHMRAYVNEHQHPFVALPFLVVTLLR